MRIAVGVEYQGAAFCGWQRQINASPSVQEVVELALSKVADTKVEIVCAGRTDKGVHASAQVVHFDAPCERSPYSWKMGSNTHLPPTVRLLWAHPVDDTFDARYSASARTYRYFIHAAPSTAFSHELVTAYPYAPLQADLMHEAAQCLVGEHDFSAFRSSSCQAKSPVRDVHHVKVLRKDNLIMIEIKANAFLHNMVRNIVGSLLYVGAGKEPVNWMQMVLESCNRQIAAPMALPHGLYLCHVDYPARYQIPINAEGPWVLTALMR